jgi:hypothetical protein
MRFKGLPEIVSTDDGYDLYYLRVSMSDGRVLEGHNAGGHTWQHLGGISVFPDGDPLVGGSFNDRMTFEWVRGKYAIARGGSDAFAAKWGEEFREKKRKGTGHGK